MHKKRPRPSTESGARAERLLPMSQTKTELVNDQLLVDLAYNLIIIDFDIGLPSFLYMTSLAKEHEASLTLGCLRKASSPSIKVKSIINL